MRTWWNRLSNFWSSLIRLCYRRLFQRPNEYKLKVCCVQWYQLSGHTSQSAQSRSWVAWHSLSLQSGDLANQSASYLTTEGVDQGKGAYVFQSPILRSWTADQDSRWAQEGRREHVESWVQDQKFARAGKDGGVHHRWQALQRDAKILPNQVRQRRRKEGGREFILRKAIFVNVFENDIFKY